jgi:hypothetical protein
LQRPGLSKDHQKFEPDSATTFGHDICTYHFINSLSIPLDLIQFDFIAPFPYAFSVKKGFSFMIRNRRALFKNTTG